MTILDKFSSMIKGKTGNIGIGLGNDDFHNNKIVKASLKFLENNDVNIYLFGVKQSIEIIKETGSLEHLRKRLYLINTEDGSNTIMEYLNNSVINAAIRGSMSSSDFLESVKISQDVSRVNRLALLETFEGAQFFYAPVGIDECNDSRSKISFIENALILFKSLEIEPKISILSGGRSGDMGRDPRVDETIIMAEEIISHFKETNPGLAIRHEEILIENAIKNGANLIIAPDGISGNLIYRTLVHLGDGKAYGAVYIGLDKIIIDTSRVGKSSEIYGGLLLALALIPKII